MGVVESVLREVEKVTIRPLGEVARGVEKVAIRPLGEIARELEKVTIRPLGEVARGVEKMTIRPLGEIARDLEKALVRPIGGIASRTVLLMERLIDVVERESSIELNADRHASKETLNEMATDAVQLQGDINEAIAAMPLVDGDNLLLLGGMSRITAGLLDGIGHLQNNREIMQNNAELLQNNREIMQDRVDLIQYNQGLVTENQDLRAQLNHMEARLMAALLPENNNDR